MQELDQLIEKFWTGQTTEAENKRLIQLLQQQQENYRQKMQDEFGSTDESPVQKLDPEKARQLLLQIHSKWNIGQPSPSGLPWLKRSWRGIAVAACVMILAGGLVLRSGRKPSVSLAPPVASVSLPRLVRLVNSSDTVQYITLKDGSVVQLQRNSGLSYYEPFINNRRDISLSGAALFKVAKDKAMPFSVYAGGVVTRVLGTRFRINADTGIKVTVRLLEGSIAVETRQASAAGSQAVLLKVGQEIAVDRISRSYIVSTIPSAGDNLAGTPRKKEDNTRLIFSKEPLQEVFRKVGTVYGIKLSYHPEEMNGLFFTGTFLKSDELDLVLSTICNVNDLSFKKEQDNIIISKLH
jgi:ferric-dicitrate binding protein FerR (iron transport regulator)